MRLVGLPSAASGETFYINPEAVTCVYIAGKYHDSYDKPGCVVGFVASGDNMPHEPINMPIEDVVAALEGQ